ncbi:MAG: pyridoxal phosphate-dependent aminotransferase [Pseudomonadota bacterium]|jgi:aspartate/methionine/tyrosine aminotransferase|nr:pyridoxal phosphate-dependent aminotransferase [Pseudomonadota bacterium]
MHQFEIKNAYFDKLSRNPNLRWLGQNTNHLPLPEEVKQAISDAVVDDAIRLYAPPLGIEELRQLILADLGLNDLSVMVTDGAIEGLYHACRTLVRPGDHFITTDPGWQWPVRFADEAGATIDEIPIYDSAQNFKLTIEQLQDAVTDATRVVYLVDPNNPLGICYSPEEITELAGICSEVGAYLIHDCTYRHFAYNHSLAALHYPERTITTYSFSKWLGLAGLRVGALVASADVIERFAAAPPNNLGSNVLSQRAAIAGLKVKARWFPHVLEVQRLNQSLINAATCQIDGLITPIYPSNGNFMIIDVSGAGINPDALVQVLQREDIMIRQGGYHSQRFGGRFVKVSTTVPTEWVEAFCDALPAAVDMARGLNEVGQQF